MGSVKSKLREKSEFTKCFVDDFPKSIFFFICLPCFRYLAVAAFVPAILCLIACSCISSLMLSKHVILKRLTSTKTETIDVETAINLVNDNNTPNYIKRQLDGIDFTRTNMGEQDDRTFDINKKNSGIIGKMLLFFTNSPLTPVIYMVIYPILWTLLISFVLKMRRNYLVNMYMKNNVAVPDNLKSLTYGDILKKAYKAGIAIAVLSVMGFFYYDFITILIIIIGFFPQGQMIGQILQTIKDTLTRILTKNGARIGLISTGSGAHAPITMIPILGPIFATPLMIITPILVATFLSFTILCKQLGLDKIDYDTNPFKSSNFKDQVKLGFSAPM